MTKTLTLLLVLLCCSTIYAQDTKLDNNPQSLESQFEDVIDGSNNYQEYKVIKKFKINQLRENILDTVAGLEGKIKTLHAEIDTQKNEIASLSSTLGTTKEDLALSRQKENGIEILGVLTQKSTYNALMWSIIGILIAALVFFIYKFNRSNSVTREAQLKLAETEIEFEAHRQKKLEEVQQIRRKLQDEINKSRKVT